MHCDARSMSLEHSEAGWRSPPIASDLHKQRKGQVDRQIESAPLFSSSIASRLVHAAAGFEKPRTKEGGQKSVYYCPTRLYPNEYTPIPSTRTANLPSARHKRSSASHIFVFRTSLAIEQHLPKSAMERHSHIPTSLTAHCVPSQYPSTAFPKGSFPYRLQCLLAMTGSRQQVPRALPSGIGQAG